VADTARPPLLPPRLVLRVAAVGNRRFGTANGIAEPPEPLEAAASAACTVVLQAIRKAVADIHREEVGADPTPRRTFPSIVSPTHFRWESRVSWLSGKGDMWERRKRENQPAAVFSSERPLITILSGLACGGDSLVKAAALALNRACDPETTIPEFAHVPIVVLEPAEPVPADGFLVGIIPPRLTGGAAPLERGVARAHAENTRARTLGFRAQSEALRHHADVLIAVWDPDADSKAGGTAETVDLALRERLPVIAIRLGRSDSGQSRSQIDLLRSSADGRQPAGGLGKWETALETCLRQVLAFPDPPPGPANRRAAHEDRQHSSYHPRVAFHAFLENSPFRVPWPGRLRQRWAQLWRRREDRERKPRQASQTQPSAEFRFWYGLAKDRASEISRTFGDAHRGGILASYVLGAFAVLIALLGNIVHRSHGPQEVVSATAGLELLALVLLFALWRSSMFQDWHGAYADTRILAEALRCMEYVGPLGVHTPLPKLPPHLGDVPDGSGGHPLPHDPRHLWSVWYFRALVRQAPIQLDRSAALPLTARRAGIVDAWIGSPPPAAPNQGSQIDFHCRTARRNADLIQRIEQITMVAFVLVMVAALWHFVGSLFITESPAAEHLEDAILFVCVGTPAALAALMGFLSQIDATRLKQRSESMIKLLADRHRVLSSLDLRDPDSVETRWLFPIEAAVTAGLMVDETADWALIYRNSHIHAA
jgi:hypothetical protein